MFDTLRDNSKIIVYIVVVAFVISGGFMGYGAYLNNQGGGGGGQSPEQSPSVVAEVNGMEISQQEYFSLLQQQAPQSNLNESQIIPFRYNVLNALIERKLLMAQAEEMDVEVEVSESEIDENYNNILEQNDMTDEELADELSEQDYTIGDLREDIESSIEDNKIVNETIDQGIGEIEVSEEEIEDFYQEQYPETEAEDEAEDDEERPELSEVREELEQELRSQKRNEAVESWLADLREDAEITINDPVLKAYHDLEKENYDEAAAQFSSFVEQEDTDPSFYSYLAQAYEGQDNLEEAETVYKDAVESYPDNNDIRFNYAQFLADQDNNEEAIAQLDEISASAEGDFMTYYQLYMMYSRLGEEEKAQSAMEEVQSINQDMETESNQEIDDTENLEEEAENMEEEEVELEDPLEIENTN
ncbi:MAG: SurA N-terminal domain-containing protein [Halanaerobium sp.]